MGYLLPSTMVRSLQSKDRVNNISDSNVTHVTRIRSVPQSSLAPQQHLKKKANIKRSVVTYLGKQLKKQECTLSIKIEG